MEQDSFVQAVFDAKSNTVKFIPCSVQKSVFESRGIVVVALKKDAFDDPVLFDTFGEANAVCHEYVRAPEESVCRRVWNSQFGEWEEWFDGRSRSRSDREDFHSDG